MKRQNQYHEAQPGIFVKIPPAYRQEEGSRLRISQPAPYRRIHEEADFRGFVSDSISVYSVICALIAVVLAFNVGSAKGKESKASPGQCYESKGGSWKPKGTIFTA